MKRLGYAALVAAALLLVSLRAHAEVQPDPKPITWKKCSSTIATGGTAQNAPLGAAIPNLRGFFLQNPSGASESLFFDATGPAGLTGSPELIAGASVTWGPGTIFAGTMSVIGATGGHAFTCQYGQ